MQNEPNFRGGRPRHADPVVRNKANCLGGGQDWVPRRRKPEDVGRGRPTHEEPRGNRAKRSQLAPQARRALAGPNRAKRTQFGPASGEAEAPEGEMRKTNPISGGTEWDGAWGTWDEGANAQNEPNLPSGAVRFTLAPAKRIVQNEPNLPLATWHGHLAREFHGRDAHAAAAVAEPKSCKTNPIPSGTGWARPQGRGTRGRCAKRTQFAARRTRVGGTDPVKQSQFVDCGLRIWDCAFRKACCQGLRGPVVQTNPIGRIDHAKRTQSATRRTGIGETDRAKRSQFGGKSCETNPIGRANRVKQSQFCPSDRTGKYFAEKDLWRIEHAGDLGKTKPIRAPAALGKDRQGWPCRGGTELYKQTQFAPDRLEEPPGRDRKRGRGQTRTCKTKPILAAGRHDASGIRHRMPGAPGMHPFAGGA